MTGKTRLLNVFRAALILSRFDRLLRPMIVGSAPGSCRAALAPNHYQYPRPTIREAVVRGARFELDISNFMEWFLYFGIQVEPRDSLLNLMPRGGVAVDVGTNVGEVALALAMAGGRDARVIGFEPNPRTFARCVRNVALNRAPNVEVHNLALGHRAGLSSLETPSPHNCAGDRLRPEGALTPGEETVRVDTLDEFVARRSLERLDLLKVDVEGFELNVLRGAEAVLRKFRPVLFVELSDVLLSHQGCRAADVVRHLEALRYQICNAQTGEVLNAASDLAACHFDIVGRPLPGT